MKLRNTRLVSLLSLLVLTLLLGIRPVAAHGYLLRSIPEEGAVLERPPARIQYWFSEGLEAQFSSLRVLNQQGDVVTEGGLSPENNALLTARLPRDLPDGAYIVDMRIAFASDGHVIAQSRVFFVGAAVSGVDGQAALNQVNPLEVIWRTLSLSSTMLLFGVCILYSTILVPAWGSKSFRAGLLPPRVMTALNRVMIAALAVAFIGSILALLQQSMVFFEADVGRVISQSLWAVVRTSTRFGDLWTARMFLLVLITMLFALSLYWRTEQPDTVRPFWTANAWAGLRMVGTFSAGSHAAGSIIWPWVATFNDWLHGIGVGLWIGGLAALAFVLPTALAPYQGEQRRQALLAVMQRFSRLAVSCLVLVIATGIYSALTWVYTPPDVTSTPFGGTLVVKIVLVAGLLIVALAHHMALRPERYARWQGFTARVSGFIPTLRLETGLAFLVLASVGVLSATPVPIPYFIQEAVPSPSESQSLNDLDITLTLTPGGPGINTYDVSLTRAGQPVNDVGLRLQMVSPQRDVRGGWDTLENAEEGLYIGAGAEIDRAGQWWSLLDVTLPDGSIHRAAFDWQITDAAAVQITLPPRPQQIIALVIVLLAVMWVLYPFAYWVYQRLDLSPANVTVAVGAVVGTVVLTLIGVVVIQNTDAQYVAAINPPPTVVNAVIPSQESLDAGAALYRASCPSWESDNQGRFVDRLARTRDEQLFAATRDGWQGSAACDTALTDAQRWDIVNYIRTFQRQNS
ncbi:MAG: CopD family protein [Anaerolineae bacterium]|nr:CopD family protein [Anaerolineae bacterium]